MTGSFKRSVHYERRPVASPIGSLTVQTYGLEYVQGLWVIDYGIDLVKESRPDGAVYTINAKIKGLDLNGKGLKDMGKSYLPSILNASRAEIAHKELEHQDSRCLECL